MLYIDWRKTAQTLYDMNICRVKTYIKNKRVIINNQLRGCGHLSEINESLINETIITSIFKLKKYQNYFKYIAKE